jgi:hypothetical protein
LRQSADRGHFVAAGGLEHHQPRLQLGDEGAEALKAGISLSKALRPPSSRNSNVEVGLRNIDSNEHYLASELKKRSGAAPSCKIRVGLFQPFELVRNLNDGDLCLAPSSKPKTLSVYRRAACMRRSSVLCNPQRPLPRGLKLMGSEHRTQSRSSRRGLRAPRREPVAGRRSFPRLNNPPRLLPSAAWRLIRLLLFDLLRRGAVGRFELWMTLAQ